MWRAILHSMDAIYKAIETLLRARAKKHGLLALSATIDSKAQAPKQQLHLYGKKDVAIGKRKAQKTYVVGIVLNKNFVGFYSMAYYAFPKAFDLSPELKKTLKGKSCFNIKALDPKLEKELAKMIELGIRLFKKEGWL